MPKRAQQSRFENSALAFGCNIAQATVAIYVLACLSATRPILGRSSQDTHYYQIVRNTPDLRVVFLIWRPNMATGTVKFFNVAKGFGFIAPEDGSKDVFVHATALEAAGIGTLTEGQRVSFDVVEERGKPAAGNLKAA